MKGVILSQNRQGIGENSVFLILVAFVFEPIKIGLYGFTAFFTVLVITKGFSFLSGLTNFFSIGMEDVVFSLLGFILFFLLKLFENIKEKEEN
jgi:hypothetical protein